MKKTVISVIMASLALMGFADTAVRVKLAGGDASTYVLSERPVITFPGDDMEIKTADASVTYPRASVVGIDFTDVTGVEDVAASGEAVLSYIGGEITSEGNVIEVYSMDGMLCVKGPDRVSTETLTEGVYIAKTERQAIKIYIK